ncbi:MAG: ABC transporter permease subunit [Thermoguttaceae bacterium]|jgi:peptide/nickel transport system permease protein
MSAYILRRLLIMIPTLWGVTIVSFCIMQLAPGDPLLAKAGGGAAGRTAQTREAYLIQKRDLKLDKPLLLNFNFFRDYTQPVRLAAYYMARTDAEIAAELNTAGQASSGTQAKGGTSLSEAKGVLSRPATPFVPQGRATQAAEAGDDGRGELPSNSPNPQIPKSLNPPPAAARLTFLHGLGIPDFDRRLADPQQYSGLAQAIQSHVQVFCENSPCGAGAAVDILRSPAAEERQKIGAIRSLANMVPDPFRYTYSRRPAAAETPQVMAAWQSWWRRAEPGFPPLAPQRRTVLQQQLATLAAETSWARLMEGVAQFHFADAPFFAEILLGESPLPEKVVAAMALRQAVGTPLAADVARDARSDMLQAVAENWLSWYDAHRAELEPGPWRKAWLIFADTQYAHMIGRLATFDFGRSAVRTREPVSEKIWSAVLVSAPLMILSELLIYLIAVPLGIVCAVNRNGLADRGISLLLFLLFSVPAFVAGMLFLLFFCYGDYLKWFPMLGIHRDGAEQLGFVAYGLDYLWHIALPLVSLSLFSLAGMAMYARSSMLEVIGQDYIRTARAKGLSEPAVILKHALRNAMIPIITLFSSFLPAILGGSVLVEVLFNIPGMGRLSFDSILLRDFPTLMAMIYIDSIVVMFSILLSDLLYVVVDPRISFQRQGQSA